MSIYSKIRIIFLVAALFITAFFGTYGYVQKTKDMQEMRKRYAKTALFLHRYFRANPSIPPHKLLDDEDLVVLLNESHLRPVQKPNEIKTIRQHATTIYRRHIVRNKLKVLKYQNKKFISLTNPHFRILLEDTQPAPRPWYVLLGYMSSLFFLFLLYQWLTHSLKPLRELQGEIAKVGEGNLSISLKSNKKDEIGDVANAFDEALRKIETLIQSRQLFLRSIMHELKTPIGKGKLLNEFLENGKQKNNYAAVFERLELLIEEFSKIEKMLSSNYQLKIRPCNSEDIIEHAIELMIMDPEEIDTQITFEAHEHFVMPTDFELMALALKNLIDNAIAYSPDHKATITVKNNVITVSNRGKPLEEGIETYATPFHSKSNGLGLGLYIVHNITQMLNKSLHYRHHGERNYFSIA